MPAPPLKGLTWLGLELVLMGHKTTPMNVIKRGLAILVFLGVGFLCLSCSSLPGKQVFMAAPPYPDVRFAVMSDLHYHSAALGTNGAAFLNCATNGRKLLLETPELLDAAIERINALPVDFVLIPGDLTKDGEASNHQDVANKLKALAQNGKPVFIINGNHDLQNGRAQRFSETGAHPVPSVTPSEFATHYQDHGYGAALARDTHSLSYVVEPVKGLWIMALDSCRHRENQAAKEPETAGRFSPETLKWIQQNLDKAWSQGKAVIGMMHHGVLEHYQGNRKYYGAYLVKDHESVSRMFSAHGMRLVLSGHYHAQDITASDQKKPWLYDIETGSLATYPCPFRVITISHQVLTVHSERIKSIPSHSIGFTNYARQFLLSSSVHLATVALKKYGLSVKDCALVAPQVAEAYVAHLAGDEVAPAKGINTKGVSLWGRLIISLKKKLVDGWQHDLPPADNELSVDLRTGETIPNPEKEGD
jgi:3',5'-cyclic AMP phosphodiesterase CpdA